MAEDRIDDIVSPKALKQLDDLDAKLVITQRQLVDNLEAALKFNAALSGSKSLKDLDSSYQKAAKSMESLNKAFEKERLSQIRLEQAREKAFDKYEKQLKAQESAQIKANAAAEKAASPYNQLAASLAKAEREALDLGATFGNTSKEFLQAGARVQTLRQQIDGLEQPLGRFQRNVGNYRSGFNGLGNSINQLTREFPAFTFSVQTGFLALSNNLPIFFDEIQRTNKEIATLRAQGEKVPGLFKQLALSFFSVGTILSVLITLTTIYGKEIGEFFSSIFKGREAMDGFIARQKAIAEALKETNYSEAIKNVIELRTNIQLAKDGFLDKEKVLKQYNETIGKTTGQTSSLDEAEKELNSNAEDYIRLTLLKAAAQIAFGKASEAAANAQFKRQETPEENVSLFERLNRIAQLGPEAFSDKFQEAIRIEGEVNRDAAADAFDTISKSFADGGIALQKSAAELAKDLNFDFFGGLGDKATQNNLLRDLLELNKARIEAAKNASEKILTDESQTLENRLKALDVFEKKSIELIKNGQQIELSESGLSSNRIKTIKLKAENEILNVQTDSRNTAEKLRKEDFNKQLKDLEELFKIQLDAAKKADAALLDRLNLTSEQRQLVLTNEADFALLELARQYSEGEIKSQDYAQKGLIFSLNWLRI